LALGHPVTLSDTGTKEAEYGNSLRNSLDALKRASGHGKQEAEDDPAPLLPAVEVQISDALSPAWRTS
jgi:hypothetical protein